MRTTDPAGNQLDLDWNAEGAPSPVQILIQSVGACSLVDVVIGLKQREFSEVWIDLEAERAEESPRRLTSLKLIFNIRGDVPQKLAERIVEKSFEKYCSVSNSLREDIPIDWEVHLH